MRYSLLSKYRSQLMGAAMLAVMFFHSSYLDLGPLNAPRGIAFGGVDIFVLLSGMGLAMSLTRRRQEYGPYLVRRMRRIFPAYLTVMLPYTLCLLLADKATISTFFWNATLLQYWVRPQGHFNWYMTGIMVYYILTPPLTSLLTRARRPVLATLLISLLAFGICELLYRDDYWYYMDVFFRIPVLVEGILIGLWITEDRPVTRRHILCWSLLLLCGLGVCGLYIAEVTVWAAYMFPFTTVPACLILAYLLDRLPVSPIRRFLAFIGENSLEIYLLNVSFFSDHGLLQKYFDPGPGHYIYFAVVTAGNIFLGWMLHQGLKTVIGGHAER